MEVCHSQLQGTHRYSWKRHTWPENHTPIEICCVVFFSQVCKKADCMLWFPPWLVMIHEHASEWSDVCLMILPSLEICNDEQSMFMVASIRLHTSRFPYEESRGCQHKVRHCLNTILAERTVPTWSQFDWNRREKKWAPPAESSMQVDHSCIAVSTENIHDFLLEICLNM